MKSAEEIRVELLAKRQQAAEFARVRKIKHGKALLAVRQLHDLGFPFWRILEMANLDPEYLRGAYRELHLLREIPPNEDSSAKPAQNLDSRLSDGQSTDSVQRKSKFGSQRWTADEVRVDLSDSDTPSDTLDSPESPALAPGPSEKVLDGVALAGSGFNSGDSQQNLNHDIQETSDIHSSGSDIDQAHEFKCFEEEQAANDDRPTEQSVEQPANLEGNVVNHTDHERLDDHGALARERARVEEQLREIRAHKEKQKVFDRLREIVGKRDRAELHLRTLQGSISKLSESIGKQQRELQKISAQFDAAKTEVTELHHDEERAREEVFFAESGNLKLESLGRKESLKRSISELEEPSDTTQDSARNETEVGRSPLAESPLMCFQSYRLAPVMLQDLSKCFSRTFNSAYVADLENRFMCSLETPEMRCTRKNCPDVHATEFDIDPLTIFKFMGSCVVGDAQKYRADIRDQLAEVEREHPEGPTREHIARRFIEYRTSVDPSRFLDWQGWKINC